jgi:hypothetical protein
MPRQLQQLVQCYIVGKASTSTVGHGTADPAVCTLTQRHAPWYHVCVVEMAISGAWHIATAVLFGCVSVNLAAALSIVVCTGKFVSIASRTRRFSWHPVGGQSISALETC